MVNVIWTGDTLAIVWFWQVSNLKHTPFCVCAIPERKLIAFDRLCMPCCSDKLLLFAWLNLFSLSAIKQHLNKQGAVLKRATYRYCCQMTELNWNTTLSEMARWVNIFHIAASAYSPVFVHSKAVRVSNRFWINNQKRIRKQCLQCPWKLIPNGNIQCVQGFPASVFLIGMLELLLTLSVPVLSLEITVVCLSD